MLNHLSPGRLEQFRDPTWGADLLQKIIVFTKLDAETRRDLYKLGEVKAVAEASYLAIEGEDSQGLFIILDGSCSSFKRDQDTDQSYPLQKIAAGQSFGELSLFDGSRRNASVAADEQTYVFSLRASIFQEYLAARGAALQLEFFKHCCLSLSHSFNALSQDYVSSQHLLWKHALRRDVAEA